MIKSTIVLLLLLISLSLNSQNLVIQIEAVDTVITWPWNWDVASDENRLVTVNKNGTLNIKTGESWDIIQVDTSLSSIEPRGVTIEDDGKIWFTTTEYGLWSYDLNGDLNNFNSNNSFLPVDNLRSLALHDSVMWISTDGLGLIRHDFASEETVYYTKDQYPDLKSDWNLDPFIDSSGNVWFSNRECLSKISPDLEWTNEDMRFHISGGQVNDIHIESDTEIWLAMNGGVVLFDGNEYHVILEDQFRNFLQVFKDSRGDVWLSGLSVISGDGITVLRDDQTHFFDYDDYPGIPNQVFEFNEHRDTVVAVGTIGNNIAKLVFDISSSTSRIDKVLFKVYPNPASMKIYVDSESMESMVKWGLYDLSGRMVLEGSSYTYSIDISQLQDGLYILTLDIGDEIVSKKITIANKP